MLPLALAAALPTIFGLQLGAPITLPECERMQLRYPDPGGAKPPYLWRSQRMTCQMIPDPGSSSGTIQFTLDDMPRIMGDTFLLTDIYADKLEGIHTLTMSYVLADEIIRQLTEKFGPPTATGVDEVPFKAIVIPARWAKWAMPGYRVEYRAVGEVINKGSLDIETDKARAAAEARSAALFAKGIPL